MKSDAKRKRRRSSASASQVDFCLGDRSFKLYKSASGIREFIDLTKSTPTSPRPEDLQFERAQAGTQIQVRGRRLHFGFLVNEVKQALLSLLNLRELHNIALACKELRQHVAKFLLAREHVIDETEGLKLRLSSWTSYELLNSWWRYGGISAPAVCARFSFQLYHSKTRIRCMEATARFFRSLPEGRQNLIAISINVGLICDREDFKLDLSVWSDFMYSLHKSGCESLAISNRDVGTFIPHFTLDKDLLANQRGECINLDNLAIDSSLFASKELAPWILAQLSNSQVTTLRMTNTGFTPEQLDVLFCYFNIPQLKSVELSDAWLMSIVDLLRSCPKVHTVRLHNLSSDTRVQIEDPLSLPDLIRLECTIRVASALLPLLSDICWEKFSYIEMWLDENLFDSDACLTVFECMSHKNLPSMSFAITFPTLTKFSFPFFNVGGTRPEGNVGLQVLIVKLIAPNSKENRKLLLEISPWISLFKKLKAVKILNLHSTPSEADYLEFKTTFSDICPHISLDVC